MNPYGFHLPSPSINALDLGPIHIYFYSLFMLAGALMLIGTTKKNFVRSGGPGDFIYSCVLWSIIPTLLGARLWHIFTHIQDFSWADPLGIIAIWEGGAGFMGGLIGIMITVLVLCRIRRVKLLNFADAMAPGLLIAVCFTRLGNYFNSEIFGIPTTLPWGLEVQPTAYPAGIPPGQLFHPLFLYEIVWCLIGVAIIYLLARRLGFRSGRLFAVYMVWYGAGRLLLEPLRYPLQEGTGGLDYNWLGAALMVLLGMALFLWLQYCRPAQRNISPLAAGADVSSSRERVE